MERYIERKKQRNQAGQMRCGMDWVFVWRCSQSSPLAFYNFNVKHDFRVHGIGFENIIFLLLSLMRVYRFHYPLLCGN